MNYMNRKEKKMNKKLRPNNDYWGFLIPIFAIVLFASMFTLFSLEAAFYSMMAIFGVMCAYNFYIVIRTGNPSFIIVSIYLLTAAIFMFIAPKAIASGNKDPVRLIILPMSFFGMMTAVQFFQKNLKWRGREVFELAAASVDTTSGGYTNRPLPAGESVLSFHKVNAFAGFAQRKMIALVVKEPGRILLFPVKEQKDIIPLFFLRKKMDTMTYVAFSRDGNATVQISEADYLDYRQDYSFDLLCAAMVDLFVGMIEQYANGEEQAIIDRMNQVGYGYFS
jgi:hypothetical protein